MKDPITFNLKGQEYIQLDNLLKHLSLVNSGGEAHLLITNGAVIVNSEVELRKRKKLRINDQIEFDGQKINISA